MFPCFIGDQEAGLHRCSDLIDELRHEQWLVTHHEQRHDRAVREVIQRTADSMNRDRNLFSGTLEP